MENKVAKKAIETIDLLKLIEIKNIEGFDIKPFLFQNLILKEKEFRASLMAFNFTSLTDKSIYIHCSVDAIVPRWAYMLLSSYFSDLAIPHVFATNQQDAVNAFVGEAIQEIRISNYQDKRVIVKGCSGNITISENNYIKITEKLKPIAKAISYGEACSMVPIAKR